jgi:hypothetical protein
MRTALHAGGGSMKTFSGSAPLVPAHTYSGARGST